jgi:hypothetical protein
MPWFTSHRVWRVGTNGKAAVKLGEKIQRTGIWRDESDTGALC